MEIKTAWNRFKKNLNLEGIDLRGHCYMNAKQIANRTATILICNVVPYDEEISQRIKMMNIVNGFDGRTDEEKARNKAYYEKNIAEITTKKSSYGTKEKEAIATMNAVKSSNAFRTFIQDAGIECTLNIEETNGLLYIRLAY